MKAKAFVLIGLWSAATCRRFQGGAVAPHSKIGFTLIELPAMRKGFTLIELLVVVTIIIVLLALLVPALDKAVYQAELAVCGAKLKGLGSSVVQYAMDHKRYYPHRPAVEAGAGRRPIELNISTAPGDPNHHDDRPKIAGHIQLNAQLNCPLAKSVDIAASRATTQTYTNYALYFGWRFGPPGNPQKGMQRIGDAFEWNGDRFRIMACDDEAFNGIEGLQSAHPDREGYLYNNYRQDEMYLFGLDYTFSLWETTTRSSQPGEKWVVDRNFLYEDCSVRRWDNLTEDDPDLRQVPTRAGGQGFTVPDDPANSRSTLPAN